MTLRKSSWKRLGLLALIVAVMFTFAACDSDNGDEATTPETYKISGTVTLDTDADVTDVSLAVEDEDETSSVTPESDGSWEATVVEGDVTVTPSLDGYTFDPSDWSDEVTSDESSIDFEGTEESTGEELTVESVSAIDETTLSVTFEELDDPVEVELDDALEDGQEEVTFTYDGVDYTETLEAPYGEATISGTFDSVTGEGEDVIVGIDGEEYPVSASYPGLGRYLAQVDSQVYGSNLTVDLVNGEVAGIETIELVEELDHIAFNSIVNPSYPGAEEDIGRVRGIEVLGTDTDTTVVEAASSQSDVSGSVVQIAMDRISVSGIEFDVSEVVIDGAGFYDGSYVTVSDSSVVGDLGINSYDSDISLSTVEGDVSIWNEKVTMSADSVDGDIEINEADADVTVAGTVTGDVKIDGEDATVSADVIDGALTIKEIGSTVTADTVTGTVTLEEAADLSGIAEVQGGLFVDANNVAVSGIDVDGELTINGSDAVITKSSFGELSDANTGTDAKLSEVTFETMSEDISGGGSDELEDGETLTLDLKGWSFTDMTWPVEDEDITVNVEVDANKVSFTNTSFTGDVDVINTSEEASFTDSTFASDLDLSAAAVGTDTAPTIIGGELQNSVTGIVANTSFDGTVFDYAGALAVDDVDGVSFTNTAFKDTVAVSVSKLIADEETTFDDVVFEATSSVDVAGSNAADSLVSIDGASFGEEVATTFAGSGRIDVANAEFAYDDTAAEDITLSDASLSIYFDSNTVYRPVTVTNANTARFRDGTELYEDFTHTAGAGDVRLIDSVFNSDNNTITITANDQLSVNGVNFVGEEDISLTGADTAKFIGTIDGGDLLTVDTTTVDVTTESEVSDTIFDVGLNSVEDVVTFSGVTLNDGLTTDADDLTLTDVEVSGNDLDLDGADASLTDVDVTGADLILDGADAVLDTVTAAQNLEIDAAGADLTDVDVTGALNIADGGEFTDGTTTLDSVDVTGAVNIGDGTVLDSDEVFDVSWSNGTLEEALTVNVDTTTNDASSTITFDGVDFTLTGLTTFTPTNAGVLNINNGTVEDLSVGGITSINDSFTFDGVTFTNNDVAIDTGDKAKADYEDIIIDDVALTVNDGDADVTVAGGTITDLTGTNFNTLEVNDSTVQATDTGNFSYGITYEGNTFEVADADVNSEASFTENTFENAITDVTAAATFEDNTFEDAVTLTVNTAASFDGDTFEAALDISNTDVSLANITNEIVDTDTTINVNDSATIDSWTLIETGDGVLDAVVASDKTLTLKGDIDWTDAPEFEIDASASGANVNDDNATWIPEKVEILSIQ